MQNTGKYGNRSDAIKFQLHLENQKRFPINYKILAPVPQNFVKNKKKVKDQPLRSRNLIANANQKTTETPQSKKVPKEFKERERRKKRH